LRQFYYRKSRGVLFKQISRILRISFKNTREREIRKSKSRV
jgi:hypothetical protein